ncbi:2-hydroxyhepta-2,4-diene-1,7-dioate isomerase [Carbonactinospora thermoautotrophica]|uniref:fumarylacetoacetate hydrolase family protein n=1 Tax=Carbonactinospora thermoautotrophica TaxID=1469144 RepID=UPI00226DA889|nr:fumarylacetoacetate hydrolase family protein [Carbonactinospora thermoautotrophica]MCX9192405.1 2-hydroxyhepta-2,4-diene-1,7-dioate isomerase [Carbonactinospora thermoautotrophica]
MRLATIRVDGGTRAARIEGDRVHVLPHPDVAALLADTGDLASLASAGRPGPTLDDVGLAPVVPRPGKIVCVGHNYRTHILEMGHELPAYPTLFAKFATALVGPFDHIRLPDVSECVDWEAELALVVGSPVRRATPKEAARAIAGFTVANDVSVRDWQRRTPQWLQGKTFDATTPLGPWLVTPDEVDGAADLTISCQVDGEVKQMASTADLLFGPAELVSYLSEIVTLLPGDVVLTGTPGGVGVARRPAEFLRPGQTLTTTVEGIGTCENRCVRDGWGTGVEHTGG